MSVRTPRGWRVTATITALTYSVVYASTPAAVTPQAGVVNFVMRTSSSFDQYTAHPAPGFKTWMNQHFWRIETFSPYWDSRLSWYPNGWLYADLYSIYRDSPLVTQHPDWILRDTKGNPLYIPWACGNGTCPQYAADPGSPEYRAWWIAQIGISLSAGYKGLWVDDVNLTPRIGDGTGTGVMPRDPRTGITMSAQAWETYMAAFVQEIRTSFPQTEILHNSIWYAGGVRGQIDFDIAAEIRAADYINLERGVSDSGLVGGSGDWSLRALLDFIDRVHHLDRHVVIDESTWNGDYGLAGYFLIANGGDGFGNQAVTPGTWWNAYQLNLGPALNNRYEWKGLLRRDFAKGLVLLAVPGSPVITVPLPHAYRNTAGHKVEFVMLKGGQAAVLTTSSAQPPAH